MLHKLILAALLAAAPLAGAQAGTGKIMMATVVSLTPEATIRSLYAADAPFINNTGQGVTGSKKLMARFLSKSLNKLFADDEKAAAKRGEPPTVEGDPFVDSQEGGSKDFKISLLSADAAKAQVLANFDKDGASREDVTFSLILEGGQWRIDDIAYKRADGSAETIREVLKGK